LGAVIIVSFHQALDKQKALSSPWGRKGEPFAVPPHFAGVTGALKPSSTASL
jgi:hypothetical protein